MLKLRDMAARSDFRIGPLSVSPSRRLVEGPRGTAILEPIIAAAPPDGVPAAERPCPHCDKTIFLTFDRNRVQDEWAAGRGLL